ncbi:recombinase family protein [Actinoplanes sp. NBRC 103695]|uniref:recombinase family protein n=1 Tax=Actinoplanes sp. NBRC 103695 TaxID=3032202 RepID=UPI0024A04092|nr:recombinase family protein [Actinoplanes sp. NBRC 103695]GLZ02293.1 putative recombinase [Actinoplanes sp. NBRC 103695]
MKEVSSGSRNISTRGMPTVAFAFYGRVSTEDNQDPESSRNWQLARAESLIAPREGGVVAEYFDVGMSRSLPWQRRHEASRLLAALSNPGRGFDAVVIGEPHRAFYGNQFGLTLPLFAHYGVELWVPEVGGPIDPDNEAHDLVMSVFGGMSKGERNRIKVRVRAAMASQTLFEGRYLGGRPPYGYTLRDAGPHPNPGKAADGKRLHALAPHPQTALVVRRIFGEFLKGSGLYAIAESLTQDGIPCPSAQDRARNSHRTRVAWSKSAVRVILRNPRCTGRQVWNRQRTDEVLRNVNDVALGHSSVMRWNPAAEWIVSKDISHEPLIDLQTFEQVQNLMKRRATSGTPHVKHRTRNTYVFRGRVHCGPCDRRMQGQYSHGVAYYRCRYTREYAIANEVDHPLNIFVREDALLGPIDAWLASAFAPANLERTLTAMADTQPVDPTQMRADLLRSAIVGCEAKRTQYRAALDAGADPAVVSGWITDNERERSLAQAELSALTQSQQNRLTRDDLRRLVTDLGDIGTVIKQADPAVKADLYRELGLILT